MPFFNLCQPHHIGHLPFFIVQYNILYINIYHINVILSSVGAGSGVNGGRRLISYKIVR
jgi:hypothetical protein